MLHQLPRRLGQQHLPTVPGAHDPRRVVYIDTHVTFGNRRGLTGMQAHTDMHLHAIRPGVSGKSALRGYRRRDSIRGTSKHHEEGIPLRIHLVAMPVLENATQQLPALRQHIGIALAQALQQARRPLDIGEKQRDRPRRQVLHALPLCLTLLIRTQVILLYRTPAPCHVTQAQTFGEKPSHERPVAEFILSACLSS